MKQQIALLEKEVHHRVKNSLQIVSNLLQLQTGSVTDPGTLEVFRQSQNRIRSIALVHEKLYASSDLANIDMAEYIESLFLQLMQAYTSAEAVTTKLNVVRISADDFRVSSDTAIPVGLIVNELIVNALKHAFPGGKGEITVELRVTPEKCYQLSVRDNGVGIPEALDIHQAESLGLKLVGAFVSQLKGVLRVERGEGTLFTVTFPIPG